MDKKAIDTLTLTSHKNALEKFEIEVLEGLQSVPKKLHPKYFYDPSGTVLFRRIMELEEYYLTDCELDIFKNKTGELASFITRDKSPFDLIELGAGDGFKSKYLLDYLYSGSVDFTYMPVDISDSILSYLQNSLCSEFPGIKLRCFEGEYLEMLAKACSTSDRRKVVLFLGANIGNMEKDEAREFCSQLSDLLSPGDITLIGFDLKNNPKKVLAAYNDTSGVTSKFNLNLLERINRELLANFMVDQFEHYAMYDPVNGSCRSFLVSLKDQQVHIGEKTIYFDKNEFIQMEISQKYNTMEIRKLAETTGFKTLGMIMDTNEWFVDAIWKI